jgi:hypothetical protein
MNNTTEEKSKLILKGTTNFLMWYKRIILKLRKENVFTISENNNMIWNEDKNLDGQIIILDLIADNCGHVITGQESPAEMLEKLKQAYGTVFKDLGSLKAECRRIHFPYRLVPTKGFDELDKRKEILATAGGNLSDAEEVEILIDGLTDSFWFMCRGNLRMKGLSNLNAATVRKDILQYWHAFGGLPDKKNMANATKTTRQCAKCLKERPELKSKDGRLLFETHDTEFCKAQNKGSSNYSFKVQNKGSSNYSFLNSSTILDSGSNRHYFRDKPSISYRKCSGQVYGPNNSVSKIIGTGDV